MKKVMILSAAALMFGLAIPEFAKATITQYKNTVTQIKKIRFQEIAVADIPKSVNRIITTDYAGCKVDKVFLGSDSTYKLNISKGQIREILFVDDQGELLKVEK